MGRSRRAYKYSVLHFQSRIDNALLDLENGDKLGALNHLHFLSQDLNYLIINLITDLKKPIRRKEKTR